MSYVEAPQVMIEARGLTKFFGEMAAAQEISFIVPRGQVCALLGPNGAGKSTTMRMLTGYLAPTAGSAFIAGYNTATDRLLAAERVGYLPEHGPMYAEMTPRSFLRYIGEARDIPEPRLRERLDFVAATCSLTDVWGKAIGKLSRGDRQRVGMAHALLHDPDVLVLDEPTSGLDPGQARGVCELIRNVCETRTVLLSTHILSDVHAVCSRVLLLNDGRLVFDGPTSELGTAGSAMEEQSREPTQAGY